MQSISVFLYITKFADFRWKMLMSAELRGCVTWFIYFLDLLQVWYNCAKFHHCRICVTDLGKGGPFCHPHPWAAPKMPILNRVKGLPADGCLVWHVIVNIMIFFSQVFLGTWISSQHNMGMAFYRDTWEKIKRCAPVSSFVWR